MASEGQSPTDKRQANGDAQWIVQPYLGTVFGFMGVTDTNFHSAGGAAAINFGKIDHQTFLQPHIDSIRARFQSA
jgi:FMN-dependent NADH-azoreductase